MSISRWQKPQAAAQPKRSLLRSIEVGLIFLRHLAADAVLGFIEVLPDFPPVFFPLGHGRALLVADLRNLSVGVHRETGPPTEPGIDDRRSVGVIICLLLQQVDL